MDSACITQDYSAFVSMWLVCLYCSFSLCHHFQMVLFLQYPIIKEPIKERVCLFWVKALMYFYQFSCLIVFDYNILWNLNIIKTNIYGGTKGQPGEQGEVYVCSDSGLIFSLRPLNISFFFLTKGNNNICSQVPEFN